jgi:hypothetical protein
MRKSGAASPSGFSSRKKRSFYKSPGAGADKRYMTGQLKLDFWNGNEMDVVFRGGHGVGETTMVIDAFNCKKFKRLYFSASTIDPWVDFIGVPKEHKDADGSYIELCDLAQTRAATRS